MTILLALAGVIPWGGTTWASVFGLPSYDGAVRDYDDALNLAAAADEDVGSSAVVERSVATGSGPSLAFSAGLVAPEAVGAAVRTHSDAAFMRGAAGQGVWPDAYVHPSVSFRGL